MTHVRYYGKKNRRYNGVADGDIHVKLTRLQNHHAGPYFNAKVGHLCVLGMNQWLDTVDPKAAIPQTLPPFASNSGSLEVPDEDGALSKKISELRETAGSLYKNMDHVRIYVIGLNAWLDDEIDTYKLDRS